MKVINQHYESITALRQNLSLSNFDSEKIFIQIFTNFVNKHEVEEIQSIFIEKNNDILFMGTTTAKGILNGEVIEEGISISIMQFEHTTCECRYFNNSNDFNLGVEIANALVSDNTKGMILFIDGIFTNGDDVIHGISSINTKIPIAGGMAGDMGNFKETFVFNNEGVYNKGAVAVSLNSDVLRFFTDYQLNWQAIGQYMTVTKAEKNILHEIDGIPARDIYSKYLGSRVAVGLPFSATEFPLIKLDDSGMEICRACIRVFDDGSLLTIGNFEVGDQVRFAFGNIDLIINDSKKGFERISNFQPEAIFAYSCAARVTFLQSNIKKEMKPLSDIAPSVGFFTYGEIFHKTNRSFLLNESLTVLGLSEQKSTPEEHMISTEDEIDVIQNIFDDKHTLVLTALTHLTGTVIDELQQAKEEREKLIKELQKALDDIKTLSGLLPICAHCKKIRDDKGYWNNLESYIEERSDASFSHGMCIECSNKFYGDQGWYKKMKQKKRNSE